MNTQNLINEAKADTGLHCDGFRQFSKDYNGIQCEIITRSHPGTYGRNDARPDTSRIQFWHHSERISRAEAERRLG